MIDPVAAATLTQPADRLTRAFELYRRTTASRSAVALLIANAIPLAGVLFLGWSLWTIVVLYWVENGIVGFWTVPRILLAQGSIGADIVAKSRAGLGSAADALAAGTAVLGLGSIVRVPMALFFLVHYGLFWFVHGVFVFALPTFSALGGTRFGGDGDLPFDPQTGVTVFPGGVAEIVTQGGFGEIVWSSVLFGAAALFISHGASFLLNYLRGGEYRTTSPARAMAAPYGRVVVLHLTILLGAFAIAFIGAPIGALVVFVVAKTILDLGLHLREHRTA